MYNIKYANDDWRGLPVAIDVKCADGEEGYWLVVNALKAELKRLDDELSDDELREVFSEYHAVQCYEPSPDEDYDIRVPFNTLLIQQTAHDVEWHRAGFFLAYIATRHGLEEDCGCNSDWIDSAYYLGNAAANHEPGGAYIQEAGDWEGTWRVVRRYYVEDSYRPAPDTLMFAYEEARVFDGYNDATLPVTQPMDTHEMACWLDDFLKGIRDGDADHMDCMPVPF
jgi:hypothetical protein